MNESTDDDTGVPTMSGKLLSGKSLLQVHMNTGKTLPKEGSKEFRPTNSWMEKKQVQSFLNERKELLEEERVEKWGCLAGAVWDHKKKLAEVTRRTGKHFQTLGFEKEGALYLYPEEALFLLETNSLELTFGGVPVSIQQGYSLLVGSSTGCDLDEYRTFSYLLRQGYKLLRCSNKQVHTRYERTIRLDQHAPVKRKHPGQISDEPISFGKIKTDLCSTTISSLLSQHTETKVIKHKEGSKSVLDEPGRERSQLKNIKQDHEKDGESDMKIISKDKRNVADSQFTVERDDQHNIKRSESSETDFKAVDQETLSEICVSEKQNSQHAEAIEDSKTNQEEATDRNIEKECNTLSELHHESQESNELSCSEKSQNACVEGAKTKAYDLAESLLSLGSVIVGKESKTENCSDAGTNLNVLQSEIRKMLGAHIETNVSEEDLTAVASSAACTILSHMTSSGNVDEAKKCSSAEIYDEDIAKEGEEICAEQNDHFRKENYAHNSSLNGNPEESLKNSSEYSSATTKCINDEETPTSQMENQTDILSYDYSLNQTSIDNSERNVESFQDKKRLAGARDLSEELPAKRTKMVENDDSLTGHQNCIYNVNNLSENHSSVSEDYEKRVQESQDKKHPISPNGANSLCDRVKRSRVSDNTDSEVEIIDVVPEKKLVEFVNLSDESSEDSVKGYVVEDYDNDGIEVIDVIDVLDSSSSDSSDNDSTSSESDNSVIVEESKNITWQEERKKILEMIPDMYNLSEISIVPPRSDLLPENVQPQHSQYIISRRGLQSENKERHSSNSHSSQDMPLSVDFDSQPSSLQSFWQPPAPVYDIATVQAIAQLILPMLGLSPNIYQQNQAWMPNNSWFPQRSTWNRESHFNVQPPHRSNWINSPRGRGRGYWTHKPHFTPRPFRGARGNSRFMSRPNYHRHFSPRYPYQRRGSNFSHQQRNFGQFKSKETSVSNPNDLSKDNEIVPFHALPQNESDDRSDIPGCTYKAHEELSEIRPWAKIKNKGKGKKPKSSMQSRYFSPPKKYTHMHRVLEEKQEVSSLNSDECSGNQSSSIKSESNSSEEDNKIENLHEDADSRSQEESENTDESCCSPSGTKPLLSPENCTSFASVFKTLQVIREADTRTLVSNLHEDIPHPKFDMFSPNTPFRKGSPPSPDFHLCIVGYTDSIPSPQALRALSEALNDSVPILFAIVSPDSISFIRVCDVVLPCISN